MAPRESAGNWGVNPSASTVELSSLQPEGLVSSNPYPDLAQPTTDETAGFIPPALENEAAAPGALNVSKPKAVAVIATLAGVSFLNTMGSGILVAALPRLAKDFGLPEGLILWPAAVYALAAGCLLLEFGVIADIIGAKRMWITGSFLFVVFTIAVGFSKTGIQVIAFRTLLGVAISMCLPTAVSLITNTFPRGTWRNMAFTMNGMGQPLGYAVGLVLDGAFTNTIGWRWAYYMMAIINFIPSLVSIWSLPYVHNPAGGKRRTHRLLEDIDWLDAIIISAALGILLYVLAMTSSSY